MQFACADLPSYPPKTKVFPPRSVYSEETDKRLVGIDPLRNESELFECLNKEIATWHVTGGVHIYHRKSVSSICKSPSSERMGDVLWLTGQRVSKEGDVSDMNACHILKRRGLCGCPDKSVQESIYIRRACKDKNGSIMLDEDQ